MEEDHAAVVVEYVSEEVAALSGEAVHTEYLQYEAEHVAHDESAEDVVERQQTERRQYAQQAQPLVLLSELRISADGAEAGLAADGQLAEHDDHADEDDQEQVDNQEREAAVATHFVREAPNVAKADRRADGRHQETKVGAP